MYSPGIEELHYSYLVLDDPDIFSRDMTFPENSDTSIVSTRASSGLSDLTRSSKYKRLASSPSARTNDRRISILNAIAGLKTT